MAADTSEAAPDGEVSGPHVYKRMILEEPWQFPLAIIPELSTLCCVTYTSKSPQDTAFTFRYLNKGAANAVFTIHPSSVVVREAVSKPIFQLAIEVYEETRVGLTALPVSRAKTTGKVLRVPRGKAKTLSGEEIVTSFHRLIKPLFQAAQPGQAAAHMSGFLINAGNEVVQATLRSTQGDLCQHLMDHKGVLLFPHAVNNLHSLAGKDVFVEPQPKGCYEMCWAILLEDMSPISNQSITLEIKPKWLLQSPNAPTEALRCRTCAMQTISPKERANYICPLRLLHGSPNDIRPWLSIRISHLFPSASKTSDLVHTITEHMLAYLTTGVGRTLLQHLEFLQSKLDPHGVLAQDPIHVHNEVNFNLRAAMTLRDCSLFIKVEYDTATRVPLNTISKLGDLDFKSAEKTADWADKESILDREGAYTRVLEDDFGCWVSRMRD
ncbi:hypothetical protein J1614_001650 [Plenodomus biglobosus]|nr:hypothetical protein J1614_001650 [Plenodomus biglobosus]